MSSAPLGLVPVSAVVLPTRATLPLAAAMAMAGLLTTSGAGRALPLLPLACCTRKYWPGCRVNAGRLVLLLQLDPVAEAYCTDQPARLTGALPALKSSM